MPSEPLMAPKSAASFILSPVTTNWDFVTLAGGTGPQGESKTFTLAGAGSVVASVVGTVPQGASAFPQIFSKDEGTGPAERGLGLCVAIAPIGFGDCLGGGDNEIGDRWELIDAPLATYKPSILLNFNGLTAGSIVQSVTLSSLQLDEGWLVETSTDGNSFALVSAGQSNGTGTYLPIFTIAVPPTTKFLKISPGAGAAGNNYLVASVSTVTTPPNLGNQGCTPGYWKQSQHFDSWTPTGYTTGQAISTVFTVPGTLTLNGAGLGTYSLLQGLSFQGGNTLSGKAQILLRAAVAAVLSGGNSSIHTACRRPMSSTL